MTYSKFSVTLSALGDFDEKFLMDFKKQFQKALWDAIGNDIACYCGDDPKKVDVYKVPGKAYSTKEGKYSANSLFIFSRDILLKAMKNLGYDIPLKVLIITDVDIFRRGFEGTMFGDVECGGDMAIVSSFGMTGSSRGRGSIKQRAIKESLYLVGRMIGLQDCKTLGCAMKPAKNVKEIDERKKAYCNDCLNKLYGGYI